MAAACPALSELFYEPRRVSQGRLSQLKRRLSSLKVASLGGDISPEAFDTLLAHYTATRQLDLSAEVLSPSGLLELGELCPEATGERGTAAHTPWVHVDIRPVDLTGTGCTGVCSQAIFFGEPFDEDVLDELKRLCPLLECSHLGCTLSASQFNAAKAQLEHNGGQRLDMARLVDGSFRDADGAQQYLVPLHLEQCWNLTPGALRELSQLMLEAAQPPPPPSTPPPPDFVFALIKMGLGAYIEGFVAQVRIASSPSHPFRWDLPDALLLRADLLRASQPELTRAEDLLKLDSAGTVNSCTLEK